MSRTLFLLALSLVFLLASVSVTSAANVSVSVNWSNVTYVSKTQTTLQVVIHPLLTRASPIHDNSWSSLARLRAPHVRFASWFPFPVLSVPELNPPSGTRLCASVGVGHDLILRCQSGTGVINSIISASFGTSVDPCGAADTSCSAANTSSIVRAMCVEQHQCIVPANISLFGSPCPGKESSYRLTVQASCRPARNNTYWDFSHLDPFVEDIFCTIPNWMYDQTGIPYHPYPDSPYGTDWGYESGSKLVDPTCTQVGEFFGRMAQWYTQGGFNDEYGYRHNSPFHYPIRMWEVLNEMEHGTDIQTYICIYDAVVTAIREMADPDHLIKFVALAEGDASKFNDYSVFLNISNHRSSDIPLDWISYHYYASTASRTDVQGYEGFFAGYDGFIQTVKRIESIRLSLSPTTRTTIDEIGVILPDDNDNNATPFPLIYFNAVGACYAYLFGHLSGIGIDVLGSSQLMGSAAVPNVLGGLDAQFPSVTLLNWTTGTGTARYWVLDLLLTSFAPGDSLVQTSINPATGSPIFAQGFTRSAPDAFHRVLLVNTKSTPNTVTMNGITGGEARVVDEASGGDPPRRSPVTSDTFVLAPFAVAVITLPTSSASALQDHLVHTTAAE